MTDKPHATLVVDPAHPIFAGHFPGEPIVPGVMLLDWVMREAAVTLGLGIAELRVRETKFFEPLLPAQQAELYLQPAPTRCAFHIRRATRDLASGFLEWDAHG